MPRLSGRSPTLLFGVVATGAVAQLVLAATGGSGSYDMQSISIVTADLRSDPLQAYDSMRWPYPPGYFPWLLLSSLAGGELISWSTWVRLPLVAANVAIALMVADTLRLRGASLAERVAAAGLVVLGPVFLAITYHGQIDSAAIVFAVAAFWLWLREVPHRWLVAGALIGAGAATKTVPIFLVFALLPAVRTRRDLISLVGGALAVPLLALAPFLVFDGGDTLEALRSNQGFAGFGALSLVLMHPDLADLWAQMGFDSGAVAESLTDVQPLIVGIAVAAVATLLVRQRVPPLQGAVLIWLAVFAVNPNFAWQYLIWGLPFFLMAGYLREVLWFQLLVAIPLYLFFGGVAQTDFTLDVLYTPLTLAAWLAIVAALVLGLRAATRRPGDGEVAPPRRAAA